jgi:Zn-dependent metalloprotease
MKKQILIISLLINSSTGFLKRFNCVVKANTLKKFIVAILVFLVGTNYYVAAAQLGDTIKSEVLNTKMQKIAKSESTPNWVKFKDDVRINPKTVFIDKKSEFDLKENDKMVLNRTEKDDLGFTHYQYQQYYKNIKVDGGTYTVHTNKDGITYAANGNLDKGIDINVVPALTANQVIDIALNYVNAKEYMWQSEFWEKNLKERTGKIDTTYYPIPQLVIRGIVINKSNMDNKQYILAYRLDIYSSSPNYSQRIYIDANTGEILQYLPLQSN